MEINFENRETQIFREYCSQVRRTQESVECVVPDTHADIEKIVTVQGSVFLKSKDINSRGIAITGELFADVLYIRDGRLGICSVCVRKPFTLEYEVEAPKAETLAQISLFIQGIDVRIINPRKISVCFELEGRLDCYSSENICVEALLPDDMSGLYAKMEMRTFTLPNTVCEKSFSLNEQFGFHEGQAAPLRLISENVRLQLSDCQLLGRKLIVKGSAELTIYEQKDEDGLPAISSFSAPFSQIIEINAESMQYCTIRPEITGAYFDLIDTISGEKALDVELHAVLQITCCNTYEIHYISDAYSNLMPSELVCQTQEYALASGAVTEKIQAKECLSLMEKCEELVQVFSSLSRITTDDGSLNAAVVLDFLYYDSNGKLTSCRRTITISKETESQQLRILRTGPVCWNAEADGENVDCSVSVELEYIECRKESLSSAIGVVLNEEHPYVQGSFPTLTLVKREGESLWTLAKRYHSSEEKIREINEDAENCSRMLMIPKCI